MRYVFLDTNIYVICALMSKQEHGVSLLERLDKALDVNDAKLLLPEVVKAELNRNIEVKWTWFHQSLINYRKLVKEKNPLQVMDADIDNAIDEIQKAVSRNIKLRKKSVTDVKNYMDVMFSDDGKVEFIPLSSEVLAKAMVMTLSRSGVSKAGSGMYGKPGRDALEAIAGLRFKYGFESDCLILASLAEFVNGRMNPAEDEVILCTDDGGYMNKGGTELDESVRAAFDFPVVPYRRLDTLLAEVFKVKGITLEVQNSYHATEDAIRDIAILQASLAASMEPITQSIAASMIPVRETLAALASLQDVTWPISSAEQQALMALRNLPVDPINLGASFVENEAAEPQSDDAVEEEGDEGVVDA